RAMCVWAARGPRIRPPPSPPLFPYTTLFRSESKLRGGQRLVLRHLLDLREKPEVVLEVARLHARMITAVVALRELVEIMEGPRRSEEHTSELQSPYDLVCGLLLEKKKLTRED